MSMATDIPLTNQFVVVTGYGRVIDGRHRASAPHSAEFTRLSPEACDQVRLSLAHDRCGVLADRDFPSVGHA